MPCEGSELPSTRGAAGEARFITLRPPPYSHWAGGYSQSGPEKDGTTAHRFPVRHGLLGDSDRYGHRLPNPSHTQNPKQLTLGRAVEVAAAGAVDVLTDF
jgi:hypothetical protein